MDQFWKLQKLVVNIITKGNLLIIQQHKFNYILDLETFYPWTTLMDSIQPRQRWRCVSRRLHQIVVLSTSWRSWEWGPSDQEVWDTDWFVKTSSCSEERRLRCVVEEMDESWHTRPRVLLGSHFTVREEVYIRFVVFDILVNNFNLIYSISLVSSWIQSTIFNTTELLINPIYFISKSKNIIRKS